MQDDACAPKLSANLTDKPRRIVNVDNGWLNSMRISNDSIRIRIWVKLGYFSENSVVSTSDPNPMVGNPAFPLIVWPRGMRNTDDMWLIPVEPVCDRVDPLLHRRTFDRWNWVHFLANK
jgi:hypothetical protein